MIDFYYTYYFFSICHDFSVSLNYLVASIESNSVFQDICWIDIFRWKLGSENGFGKHLTSHMSMSMNLLWSLLIELVSVIKKAVDCIPMMMAISRYSF